MTHTVTIDSGTKKDLQAEMVGQDPLGFVLLWSHDEPERVGEVTFVPEMDFGAMALLGRAETLPEDDLPRMEWVRQQPGISRATGPLNSPYISRTQLQVEVHGPHMLRVTNVGRCPLIHESSQAGTIIITPGEVIELQSRVLLMCIQRPRALPVNGPPLPLHPFGEADRHGLVGESPEMWVLRERIAFVAGRAAHVLIRGPSGTGKELVAQAIHHLSPRAERPMISRNAATFPEALIDAELFGNTRNYPNPGMPERTGIIGEADGSTLFLDEFAELPLALQAHLLRVLDGGEYTRLGEPWPRRADFRLIAATNRPEQALKEDVLARLRLRLSVSGLDQRREDIPLIARHLLRRLAREDEHIAQCYFPNNDPESIPRMSCELVERLVTHSYTTHVRELEALMWKAMTHGHGSTLELWPIEAEPDGEPVISSPEIRTEPAALASSTPSPPQPRVNPMSIPPEMIQACLDRHGGRQGPVWRELGLSSRHVLTRLVRKYGLTVKGRGRG